MTKISKVSAREILDSRGFPTVEAQVELDNGVIGVAAVPSGASTGAHEACELRDGDVNRYGGKGVLLAVENVNTKIAKLLESLPIEDQRVIDERMIEEDATPNKTNFGANAILSVSLACAYANANNQNKFLFETISNDDPHILPVPLLNILNGGAHATNNIDFQEFMIAPIGAETFSEALRMGAEVYQNLKGLLTARSLSTGLGDEGGFAPNIDTPDEVLSLLSEAIEKTNLKVGDDIAFALDVASTEFYFSGKYVLSSTGESITSQEMSSYLAELSSKYPIVSIEDGLAEDDWEGWQILTEKLGEKIQLVGDDLFVTNTQRLQQGIEKKVANSILIKLNQIGTLTETLDVMELAKQNGYTSIASHRSGETHDTTIADLAVATNCGQIKTGAPARTDRISKYNQLLRIEERLGDRAIYSNALR